MNVLVVYFAAGFCLITLSFLTRERRARRRYGRILEAIDTYLGRVTPPLMFPDHRYRRKLLNWWTEGVDTTYFALNAFRRLRDENGTPGFNDHISKYLPRTLKFTLLHYDPETGGIKHNAKAASTVYGGYCGVSLVKFLYHPDWSWKPLGRKKAEEYLDKSVVKNLVRFVSNCRIQDSGFAGTLGRTRPTLIDTDAALGILWNLGYSPPNPEGIRRFIFSCAKTLNSSLGFVNTPQEKEPCCCITSYAVRSLIYLEAMRREEEDLSQTRERAREIVGDDKLDKVVNLLSECFRPTPSMFSKTPNPECAPTLYHTDLVLSFLKTLEPGTDIKPLTGRIELERTFHSINEFRTREGGYAFGKGLSANVHSTRSAVHIATSFKRLKLTTAELFDGEHIDTRSVRRFLKTCFSRKLGAYSGYRRLAHSRFRSA